MHDVIVWLADCYYYYDQISEIKSHAWKIDCITQMFDQHILQNKLEGHGTFHAWCNRVTMLNIFNEFNDVYYQGKKTNN